MSRIVAIDKPTNDNPTVIPRKVSIDTYGQTCRIVEEWCHPLDKKNFVNFKRVREFGKRFRMDELETRKRVAQVKSSKLTRGLDMLRLERDRCANTSANKCR